MVGNLGVRRCRVGTVNVIILHAMTMQCFQCTELVGSRLPMSATDVRQRWHRKDHCCELQSAGHGFQVSIFHPLQNSHCSYFSVSALLLIMTIVGVLSLCVASSLCWKCKGW